MDRFLAVQMCTSGKITFRFFLSCSYEHTNFDSALFRHMQLYSPITYLKKHGVLVVPILGSADGNELKRITAVLPQQGSSIPISMSFKISTQVFLQGSLPLLSFLLL